MVNLCFCNEGLDCSNLTVIVCRIFLVLKQPCFAFCISGEALRASDEEMTPDMICVSNLCEDVTILQLVEHFGMIGDVKVSTFEQPRRNYYN